MDNLLDSAVNFKKLCGQEYKLKLMHRPDSDTLIVLRFEEANFHHLAGIQYAHDLKLTKGITQAEFFSQVLNGKITEKDLAKSANYKTSIKPRLAHLAQLEVMLDKARNFFSFNPKALPFHSNIPNCKALALDYGNNKVLVYLFIGEDKKTKIDFILSFFPQDKNIYTTGQSFKYLKIKIKNSSVLYKHRSATDQEIQDLIDYVP
jgi:hypothetical protein